MNSEDEFEAELEAHAQKVFEAITQARDKMTLKARKNADTNAARILGMRESDYVSSFELA
jgi:hypothetical protein